MAKKTAIATAPDTAASASAMPAAVTKNDARSSSSLLFVIVPLLVALIGGAWTTLGPQFLDSGAVVAPAAPSRELNMNESVLSANPATVHEVVVDKYESEIVRITTQKLLAPSAKPDIECPAFAVDGDMVHVETVLGRADELKAQGRVFLMLNGQNEGVSIPWRAQDACLHELATFAALTLGTDADILVNGVKLMTQDGLALTTVEQLDTLRIAHVLFDFQIWVWPGIKVGHVFTVEGCTVKTMSLRPKVFSVEGFFTEAEANEIMRQGIDNLSRSPVDSPEAVDGYHSDRTSYTAFLSDNAFTRDFRVRTAVLTRLPSPSFTERLQLVRYEHGQFFRKHEDYFDSKQFIPKKSLSNQEYKDWTHWAAERIEALVAQGREDELPEAYRPGGAAFPDFANKDGFQHALLSAFMEDADASDFFVEHADIEWGTWIRDNLEMRAYDIVGPLLKDRGYMLTHIIKSWAKRAALPELQYTIPKRPVSGVSHYFRWVRWAKERVQDMLDTADASVPAAVRPDGLDYPTYNMRFQNRLVEYVLADTSKEELVEAFSEEWYDWLVRNRKAKDVLIEALRSTTKIMEFVTASWTKRAGDAFAYTMPTHLHHFEPNRFVTLFLYLNDCPEGGETVFPYSKERVVTGIKREGMDECSEGLAVPPTKLVASMFYSQTPLNEVDPSSLHGGCPPHKGVKYGANSFAWNADADEGANAWDLGDDMKTDPNADYDDNEAGAFGAESEDAAEGEDEGEGGEADAATEDSDGDAPDADVSSQED